MLTFDPEKSIARAQRVLPAGGWADLGPEARKLILRAAAGMVASDGPPTSDERRALEHFAEFLALPASSWTDWGTLEALARDLAPHARDRALARHLFVSTYLVGMSDGVLMDSERGFLETCARALGLEPRVAEALEGELHGILYEEVLEACVRDGEISARERKILAASAKLLGLSDETAGTIESAYRERTQRGGMGAY